MARQDEIRVGDAERDAVMVALHDHFAAGRLDRGELDGRLDAALSARTRGDLRTLVRDLPAPTGLPEPEPAAPGAVPWGPGMAVMFGGPGHPAQRRRHHRRAAWHEHHAHLARRHRHGPPAKAFALMLGVFLALALTVGPGAGVLAVLQIAVALWLIRAVLIAFGVRRSRRSLS